MNVIRGGQDKEYGATKRSVTKHVMIFANCKVEMDSNFYA